MADWGTWKTSAPSSVPTLRWSEPAYGSAWTYLARVPSAAVEVVGDGAVTVWGGVSGDDKGHRVPEAAGLAQVETDFPIPPSTVT
jgi:hypothetical protein